MDSQLPRLACVLLFVAACAQRVASVDHSLWEEVLREVVVTDVVRKGIQFNAVDFERLRTDASLRQKHVEYMDMLATVDFTALPTNEAVALLINAYNAFATDMIVRENPSKSIREIPGVFGLKTWPMNQGGAVITVSLDDVEHTFLRMDVTGHDDPRIHAAVNCMSLGCPDLREEAYTGDKIDSQLTEQTFRWLQNESKGMRVDEEANEILLSMIFGWFSSDFISSANGGKNDARDDLQIPLDFALLYAADDVRQYVEENKPAVSFTPYDWDLISV